MITQCLTASFKKELLQGVHDFDTDEFKNAGFVITEVVHRGQSWQGGEWKSSCVARVY